MTKILKKNESVVLNAISETPVNQIIIGAAWTGKPKGLLNKLLGKESQVDLDFSCILYDNENQTHDSVWYANLNSRDGAVRHSGDETTGESKGMDEVITITLAALPPEVTNIFFVISSFSGQSLIDVQQAYVDIGHAGGGAPLVRFTLREDDINTAQIMMNMKRVKEGWMVKAIGKDCEGKTIQDLYSQVRKELYAETA